ncbi:hypothetical protein HPB51_003973 [Rhipicephalus microplus]|uniref:Uncharacterized protein n=1 Tax=Rhipicephalus microplus TaxID=6941 RepID=A0A9J6DSM2_RHIMP|nr:hypothetical protein HPB51_003973 [Rhipicephalus microplus]
MKPVTPSTRLQTVDEACKTLLAEVLERQGVTEGISFSDFRDADSDVQTSPDMSDEAIVALLVEVSPNDSDEDICEAAVNERGCAGGSMRIKLVVGHVNGEGGESRRLLQGENIRGQFCRLQISLQFLYELLQSFLYELLHFLRYPLQFHWLMSVEKDFEFRV